MQNKPDFKRELRCLAWGLLAAVLAVLAFWAVCLTVSFFLLTGVIWAIDWMFGWY